MLRSITSNSIRIARHSLATNIQSTNLAAPAAAATTQSQWQFLRAFSEESSKLIGHVKWFDTKKGFGFIIPTDGSEDVFVHQTSIHAEGFRSLAEGEQVEFELLEEDNGKRSAHAVTGPDGSYVQGAPRSSYYNEGFNNNES